MSPARDPNWPYPTHICGAPEIRQKVADALAKIPGGKVVTPEGAVATGGLGLGVYLVDAVPTLGLVGAPVIAGLIVILYTLGVRGFCEWTDQLRTDEEEKY